MNHVIKKYSKLLFILLILTFSKLCLAGYWYELPMSQAPGPLISKIQKRLTELGFFHGIDDGIWDKNTTKAYAKFSKKHGLSFDKSKVNRLPVSEVLTKEHIKELWNIDFDPNDRTQQEESINFLKQIGVQLY
jgi:hypothetical protein